MPAGRQTALSQPPIARPARRGLLGALLWCALALTAQASLPSSPRVGVTDFYPLCHTGTDDRREGLFIEILKYVAEREGWRPRYVPGTMGEHFERLQSGELDLIAGAPYSLENAEAFEFTKETVISTWATVFASEKAHVESPLDLAGLSVGLVRDDPYNQEVRTTIRRLNISCSFVELNHYTDVFKALEAGWVDAGVVDRLYAAVHEGNFRIRRTPLILSPVELRFAAPRGSHSELIAALDYHLSALKSDPHSTYYRILEDILGDSNTPGFPKWLAWVMAGGLGLLALFAGMSVLLRYEVKAKTAELSEKNTELEKENAMRQMAENELRRSNEMLEKTLGSMRDALLVTDSEGNRILHYNRAAAELFGRTGPQLARLELSVLFASATTFADIRRTLYPRIDRHGFFVGDADMRRGDTDAFPARISITPIRNEQQQITSLVVIVRDQSAERALHDSEKRLRIAQRMEAIGTLAGGIAHDFNNILMPILGYTELVKRHLPADASALHHFTDQVAKAADRAKDLVAQILAFSRQRELERIPLHLAPIVKEALKLLRASLPSTINIEFDSHTEHDVVLADPTQIHQVIMNLTANSAHAMRQSGGVLKVALSEVCMLPTRAEKVADSPDGFLCVTVADSGHGIPQDIVDRIFDPFFTTKSPGEGTGMGLAVVHGIVKSYGGTVTVDSVEGKGTTFCIFLPRAASVSSKAEPPVRGESRGNQESVLFIDDEEMITKLFETALNDLGFSVVAETDSRQALEAFRAAPERFDVVITDQTMPGLTGADIVREILAIRPDMPIVLCTGYSETFSREDALAIGVREYVTKPLDCRALAGIIRRAIDGCGLSTDDAVTPVDGQVN
ncbi:MAG: response regulator [Chitinivibrionales bacterium]|nr:response regulator [Chitinivibrionales bacterium]